MQDIASNDRSEQQAEWTCMTGLKPLSTSAGTLLDSLALPEGHKLHFESIIGESFPRAATIFFEGKSEDLGQIAIEVRFGQASEAPKDGSQVSYPTSTEYPDGILTVLVHAGKGNFSAQYDASSFRPIGSQIWYSHMNRRVPVHATNITSMLTVLENIRSAFEDVEAKPEVTCPADTELYRRTLARDAFLQGASVPVFVRGTGKDQ